MASNVVVPVPFKIAIDTQIPTTGTGMSAFGAGGPVDKAKAAFEKAMGEISSFLVATKEQALSNNLGADSITVSCGLSVTVGASWIVEVSATGDVGISATWNV